MYSSTIAFLIIGGLPRPFVLRRLFVWGGIVPVMKETACYDVLVMLEQGPLTKLSNHTY